MYTRAKKNVKGLGHIVARALVQSLGLVLLTGSIGEHNKRDAGGSDGIPGIIQNGDGALDFATHLIQPAYLIVEIGAKLIRSVGI